MITNRPSAEELITEAAERMQTAGLYFGHGTDNAGDEAWWALTWAMQRSPMDPSPLPPPDAEAIERFEQLILARITSRKPLAYLIGEAWFAGLKFHVSEHVLVPRSPLAELIEEGFAPWLDARQPLRVLDLGTGSGCIAIATAVHWPALQVDAVDISPVALAIARKNAAAHEVTDRVEIIHSDLLDGLAGRRYDLILANLPYVPTASMQNLPEEYRHEPVLGLEAGHDGLDLVRRLLAQAHEHLKPGGILIAEVGEAAEALDELLAQHNCSGLWLDFARGGDGVVLIEAQALPLQA